MKTYIVTDVEGGSEIELEEKYALVRKLDSKNIHDHYACDAATLESSSNDDDIAIFDLDQQINKKGRKIRTIVLYSDDGGPHKKMLKKKFLKEAGRKM